MGQLLWLLAWSAAALAATGSAHAQEPEAPGRSRHDGFMLRLTLGAGYSSTPVELEERDSDEGAIRGFSASWSFDIGGAVAENLVLHARAAEFAAVDPTVSVNGNGLDADSLLSGIMLGPALTYYFMPANLYLTLALGVSWLTADDDQSDNDSTRAGFGTNLDLGKEWWVSDNWGLGLAARFWWTHTTETEAALDATYNMLGVAALFSATYN